MSISFFTFFKSINDVKQTKKNSHIHILFSYIYMGVIFLNNMDISKMLQALSKMDKAELEAGINKANEFLKSKDGQNILNQNNQKKE